MIADYKPRRWNIMPTYRKNLIIGEYEGKRDEDDYRRIGEFEVCVKPIGYRGWLKIGEWGLVPYSIGNAPKVELIIAHRVCNRPYFVFVKEEVPQSKVIFHKTNINIPLYSEVIEFPMLEDIGKHLYSVAVFSGLQQIESVESIIIFRAFDRDSWLMWGFASLFTGIIGYLIGIWT